MISQPYKQLWLEGTLKEVSPAVPMGGANAVQLSAVVYQASTEASLWVEGSNDAENWRIIGSQTELGRDPGLYVAPAVTGVCARYVRVACSLADDASVLVAVTQQLMRL